MKLARLLIASFIFLAIGLGLLFGYTHGSAALSLGYPISDGTAFNLELHTTGIVAVVSVALTLLGMVLLVVAFISAIVVQFAGRRPVESLPRRASFAEIEEQRRV
jgi:hypothetical protein